MNAASQPMWRRLTLRCLPWPLPAAVVWLGAWALYLGLRPALGVAGALAAALVATAVAALAWPALGRWRRLIVAAGFALSLWGSGAAHGVPAWAWLLPAALLLLAYPLRAWRDAPLFPTPRDALACVPAAVPLPAGARVLDAGCGLGHGLQALHAAWPQAGIEGIEFSWPLRLAAAWRCRFARVRQGDMWRLDWSGYALVYLFQRPESMARAWAKACTEMAPGAWLVSLEFAVPGVAPAHHWQRPGARAVWLYRVPGAGRARSRSIPGGPGR